ncbi:MAG: C40 family peptidase [Clostridia bacterium]|nr:C40 family peptidase [Clostridia bacterium]
MTRKMIIAPFASVVEEPELISQQLDEMLYGETCEVLGENGSFAHVRTNGGIDGFTEKKNLYEMLHEPTRVVCKPFADLLCESRDCFRPMMTLPRGSMVDVGYSHEEKKYAFAVLPSYRIWYIQQTAVRPFRAGNRKDIVEDALSYLGTQYRWGGRTPAGIDCSGLVMMAYGMNGIRLGRKPVPESADGFVKTEKESLKPGDLLYYPWHVAMYIGDGKMIHSSSTAGGVAVADADSRPELLCMMTKPDLE